MKSSWLLAGGAFALLATSQSARAADHLDGPAASADPSADVTDLFAWTDADGTHVNLVLNVFPAATTSSKFSNNVQYVIHTQSRAAFAIPAGTPRSTLDIICTFNAAQAISCWAGSEYVTGDASASAGITSSSRKLKVFAGLRDDPFFFNLDGFKATAAAVRGAKASLVANNKFDAAGCPALDPGTATTLVNQLKTASGGGPPQDHFNGLNVLSIVVQVDKSLLNSGNNTLLSVWASTHRAP